MEELKVTWYVTSLLGQHIVPFLAGSSTIF